MLKVSLDDTLTEEAYNAFLKEQELAHNDCLLQDNETFVDLLNSAEADFRRYPEGAMIAQGLSIK